MDKLKCKCGMHGCAHFGCGKCRLTGEKCVMDVRAYHYACCPVNAELGKEFYDSRAKGLVWDSLKRRGVNY